MRNGKRKILGRMFLGWLACCLLAGQGALPAKAQTDYRQAAGLFLMVEGEEQTLLPAVVGQVDSQLYCFTAPMDAARVEEADRTLGSLVVWEKWHAAAFEGNAGAVGVWTMEGCGDEAQPPLEMVMARQGTVCTLIYPTSVSEYGALGGITLGEVLDAETGLISIDGVEGRANYPATLIDSFGDIVGVAVDEDTAFALLDEDYAGAAGGAGTSPGAPDEPAASRSGSYGGSDSRTEGLFESIGANLVVLAGSAVVLAVAVSILKRKKQQPGSPSRDGSGRAVESAPVPSAPSVPDEIPPTEGTAGGSLCLVATSGYMMGRIYPMDAPEITIGRSPTAAIPYKIESVSKLHCKLYRDSAGRWMLMDCNSRNGTYTRRTGKLVPMQPVEVFPGDVFYLGSPQYSFEIRG